MVADDWLASYHDARVIDLAINGISRRFRRTNAMLGGAQEMLDHYESLQANFLQFFPELLRFVSAVRDQYAEGEAA